MTRLRVLTCRLIESHMNLRIVCVSSVVKITICPSGSRLALCRGKTAAREASAGEQTQHSNEDLKEETGGGKKKRAAI